jgi:hypothetical protein
MNLWARMNRQPPMHHPLEACYDSVVSDPLLIYVTRFLYGKLSYKRIDLVGSKDNTMASRWVDACRWLTHRWG